jgi:hypothetical protein
MGKIKKWLVCTISLKKKSLFFSFRPQGRVVILSQPHLLLFNNNKKTKFFFSAALNFLLFSFLLFCTRALHSSALSFLISAREKRGARVHRFLFFFVFVCVRASSVVFAAEIEPLKSMSFFFFPRGVNYFFQFRRLLFTASLDGSVDYYVRGKKRKKEKKTNTEKKKKKKQMGGKTCFCVSLPVH